MGKLQEKKKQKQNALLDAAYELFTSQGIHETSVSDITKKANMAKGTFYLYFKDKYQIRDCLIHKKAEALVRSAVMYHRTLDMTELEDRMVALTDHIINLLQEDKTLLNFISKNLSWGIFQKEVLYPRMDEGETSIYDMILDMLKKSGRKFRQPDLMIYIIIELINSTCHNVVLYQEPVTLEELKPNLYILIKQIIKNYEIT